MMRHSHLRPLHSRFFVTLCLSHDVQMAAGSVRGKPLQLGRTCHGVSTLRKTKNAGKATGNQPGKYVIRETVSMQSHHSAV